MPIYPGINILFFLCPFPCYWQLQSISFSIVFDQPPLRIVHSVCCTPCTFQFTFTLSFSIGNSVYFQSPNFAFKNIILPTLSFFVPLLLLYPRVGSIWSIQFEGPNFFSSPLSLWCVFSVLVILMYFGGISKTKTQRKHYKIGKNCEIRYLPTSAPPPFQKGGCWNGCRQGVLVSVLQKKKRDLQFQRCSGSFFPQKAFFLVFLFCLLLSSLAKYHICFLPQPL